MLIKQTLHRVMEPLAECLPKEVYEEHERLHKYADIRVQKYQWKDKERNRFQDLQTRARNEPETLFLIIADEAHWRIGKSDDNSSADLQESLVQILLKQ